MFKILLSRLQTTMDVFLTICAITFASFVLANEKELPPIGHIDTMKTPQEGMQNLESIPFFEREKREVENEETSQIKENVESILHHAFEQGSLLTWDSIPSFDRAKREVANEKTLHLIGNIASIQNKNEKQAATLNLNSIPFLDRAKRDASNGKTWSAMGDEESSLSNDDHDATIIPQGDILKWDSNSFLDRKKRQVKWKAVQSLCFVNCRTEPCYIGRNLTCTCCTSENCKDTQKMNFSEGVTECPNAPSDSFKSPLKCHDADGCIWRNKDLGRR